MGLTQSAAKRESGERRHYWYRPWILSHPLPDRDWGRAVGRYGAGLVPQLPKSIRVAAVAVVSRLEKFQVD